MKKIITLCFFAFAMVLGTQSLNAQEKEKEIDQVAKAQSYELKKVLGLDDAQTSMVWRVIFSKEKAYAERINGQDIKDPNVAAFKKKVDTNFKSKMLETLSEEQFSAYTAWLVKQNKEE